MARPGGRVSMFGSFITISGHRKSFQWPMKVKIARVTRAGFARGRTMVQ